MVSYKYCRYVFFSILVGGTFDCRLSIFSFFSIARYSIMLIFIHVVCVSQSLYSFLALLWFLPCTLCFYFSQRRGGGEILVGGSVEDWFAHDKNFVTKKGNFYTRSLFSNVSRGGRCINITEDLNSIYCKILKVNRHTLGKNSISFTNSQMHSSLILAELLLCCELYSHTQVCLFHSSVILVFCTAINHRCY